MLSLGERKSLQTDRVILVPGPEREIETIAKHLSEKPTFYPGGKSPTRIGKHDGVFRLFLWNSLWGEFISIPKKVIGMAATCKDKSRAVSRVIRRGV
jgi:hypothetical protein